MTTPINSFQDILDAMERDPALRDALRRYVLTDEILALPGQIKALTEAVEALVTESRELRAGQEQIREGQRELRTEVGELRDGQKELRDGQQELRTGLRNIRSSVGRIGGDVSRVMGIDYEGTAVRLADRLVRRHLGLANATVVMNAKGYDKTPALEVVDQAVAKGLITWDEADDLAEADVIVSAVDQDGGQVYVVAEISITVQEKDRVRAIQRASALERATGVTTIPAVIGVSEESPEEPPGVVFFSFDPELRTYEYKL